MYIYICIYIYSSHVMIFFACSNFFNCFTTVSSIFFCLRIFFPRKIHIENAGGFVHIYRCGVWVFFIFIDVGVGFFIFIDVGVILYIFIDVGVDFLYL